MEGREASAWLVLERGRCPSWALFWDYEVSLLSWLWLPSLPAVGLGGRPASSLLLCNGPTRPSGAQADRRCGTVPAGCLTAAAAPPRRAQGNLRPCAQSDAAHGEAFGNALCPCLFPLGEGFPSWVSLAWGQRLALAVPALGRAGCWQDPQRCLCPGYTRPAPSAFPAGVCRGHADYRWKLPVRAPNPRGWRGQGRDFSAGDWRVTRTVEFGAGVGWGWWCWFCFSLNSSRK